MKINLDLGNMEVDFDEEGFKKEIEMALPQIWMNKFVETLLKDIEEFINNDTSLPNSVLQLKEGIKMKVINEVRQILKAAEEQKQECDSPFNHPESCSCDEG